MPWKDSHLVHTALLLVHIVAGMIGLLLGPFAMYQGARRLIAGQLSTGPASGVYRGVVLLVCLSAVALIIDSRPELWWLVPLSALTYGLAVLARVSAQRRHRFRGWLHGYVHGQGGSYIALVTAFVVVALTVDGPVTGVAQLVPWLAPTVLGTFLIEWWRRRLDTAMKSGLREHLGRPAS